MGNLLSGEENNNGAVFSETALNNVSVDQQDLAVLRENLGLSSGATSCPEANFCKLFGAHDLSQSFGTELYRYMQKNEVVSGMGGETTLVSVDYLAREIMRLQFKREFAVEFFWGAVCAATRVGRRSTKDSQVSLADAVASRLCFFFQIVFHCCLEDGEGPGPARLTCARLAEFVLSRGPRSSCASEDLGGLEEAEADVNAKAALLSWQANYAPFLDRMIFHGLYTKCFTRNDKSSVNRAATLNQPRVNKAGGADADRKFEVPRVSDISSVLSGGDSDLLPLALYCSECQGRQERLYTTASDGFCFNRLAHAIIGFSGPTLLLVRARPSSENINNSNSNSNDKDSSSSSGVSHHPPVVLGCFAAGTWKESNKFYGSHDNFLFQLSPKLRLLRSRPSGGCLQWLNLGGYGLPHGLGMGGSTEELRFFIPDELENCHAGMNCPSFEAGALLPTAEPTFQDPCAAAVTAAAALAQEKAAIPWAPTAFSGARFDVDSLEVWACGGEDAVTAGLCARAAARRTQGENVARARKVDKAAFFNNAFDREMFLGKTTAHQKQAANR
jgi:hypothetical protein